MEGPENNDLDFCQGLIDGLEYYEDEDGDGEFLKNLPTYDAIKSDFWKLYEAYYDDENYYNTWVTSALKGEKFKSGLSTQKWDQDIGTCVARVEAAQKGTAYLSGTLEVFQYFEQTIQLMKGSCRDTIEPFCTTALESWNNGAAYFVGSLEGANGLNGIKDSATGLSTYGYQIYANGGKQCDAYNTCGPTNESTTLPPSPTESPSATDMPEIIDNKGIPAKLNIYIIELFSKGATAVQFGDIATVQQTIKEIESQITVGYIQGTLKYGYQLAKLAEGADFAKMLGEGVSLAAASIPQLWKCSKKAADFVQKEYKYKNAYKTWEFPDDKIRLAFECNYECLGISCADIGSLYDGNTEALFNACKDTEVCKKPTKKEKRECKKYTSGGGGTYLTKE